MNKINVKGFLKTNNDQIKLKEELNNLFPSINKGDNVISKFKFSINFSEQFYINK